MSMPMEIKGETYLSSAEATKFLGISRPTLDNLVSTGQLTRYRQGIRKIIYYKQSDLERLLEPREYTENEEE